MNVPLGLALGLLVAFALLSALVASLIHYPRLMVFRPVGWFINLLPNGLLRLIGIRRNVVAAYPLDSDELRSVAIESGIEAPHRRQKMPPLDLPDLNAVTVDDVMVPRQEIQGIDLDSPWQLNQETIQNLQFNRLPVYRDDIDNLIGVIRVKQLLPDLAKGTLDERKLVEHVRDPYFVPEGTPLNKQLRNFRQMQRRSAFVVDEYGDIQGLITIEDIVREIAGEFDDNSAPSELGIARENDTSFIINASANIRQINRLMRWNLPTDGPKTLNGVIVEELETLPAAGAKLTLAGYSIEILSTTEHGIRQVRIGLPECESTATLSLVR